MKHNQIHPNPNRLNNLRLSQDTSSIWTWLLIATFLLVSCSQFVQKPQVHSDAKDTIDPTDTPLSEAIRLTSPTEIVTATAAKTPATKETPACWNEPGTIETTIIQHAELFREMPVRIYLPPCYEANPEKRYPTLYLLHGLQSTDSQWDELGIDETANRLISEGTVPPFIIVMPWHRTGINLIQAVPEILVPFIDANFTTASDRSSRAIGGVSKGGGQALEIGLKYPDTFAAIGMHSPAVQYLDSVIVNWVSAIPPESRPALWIDIGERDSLYPAAESLIENLQSNSIPISTHIDDGDHEAAYWETHIEGYLRWYVANWKRAPLTNPIN
jgi:enterochelin esterase-like enzyme